MNEIEFTARHDLGDEVALFGAVSGVVRAITFTDEGKVLYDVDLHEGGAPLQRVDSVFLESL